MIKPRKAYREMGLLQLKKARAGLVDRKSQSRLISFRRICDNHIAEIEVCQANLGGFA